MIGELGESAEFFRDATSQNTATGKAPTIGQSFKTGSRAELIFERWLPSEWLARKQDPDIYLDYCVEIVEKGEPTGKQLAAQIKGTQPKKGSGECRSAPRYSAKTKHIRYWLEDCQHPVFLFLIDVERETGHWLFAQRYANEHIAKASLEKPGRITMRFSEEDSLGDMQRFLNSLEAAEKYVRDLHPGSVQAALVKKRQALEKKEPRLKYSIFASEGKQAIHLSPKEPFPIQIEFGAEHAAEMVKEFSQALAEGAELKIPFGKIKLKGSPLFEEFNNSNGRFIMKFGHEASGELVLSHAALARPKHFALGGVYRLGTKALTFESKVADSPIAVKCRLGLADTSMDLRIINQIARWQRVPVLYLPYFEQLFEILDGIESGKGVRFQFMMRGVILAEDCLMEPRAPAWWRIVSWLDRCRTVSTIYGINPVLPEFAKMTDEQWELVDDLLALNSGGKRMIPMPNLSANCTMAMNPENEVKEPSFGCLVMDKPNGDVHLLGAPLNIGRFRLVFTDVNMASVSSFHEGRQSLKITGTESTMRLIERY